jgi:hypothetical protein
VAIEQNDPSSPIRRIMENWTLSAATEKEKKSWMTTIANAQEEYLNKVKTFATQK